MAHHNPYSYLANEFLLEEARCAMPPPPPPSTLLDPSMHENQNQYTQYSRGIHDSSSDMYTHLPLQTWGSSDFSLLPPLPPPPSSVAFTNAVPNAICTHPERLASDPRHLIGRTAVISPGEWLRYKNEIHRIYIDEDNSLDVTMEMMAEKHNFRPSSDQYKKQFRKWQWSKNVSAKDGIWMLQKSGQRKRRHGKATEFKYRGQTLTEENIRPRLERKKSDLNVQGFSPDASTPSGIKYTTPRDHVLSPLETQSVPFRNAQSTWTPPAVSNRRQQQGRLIWNGFTKAEFQAQFEQGLELERTGRIDEAESKFRSALDGFDNLLSSTHPETVTVAHRLASFYATNDRMKDADTVLDWLSQAHSEVFGFFHPRTVEHFSNVVEMFRNWGRPGDAVAVMKQTLFELEKRENRSPSRHSSSATTRDPRSTTPSDEIRTSADEQVFTSGITIPSDGPIDPVMLHTQLDQTTNELQSEEREKSIITLIRHCEQFPDELMVHSLLCRATLVNHYDEVGDMAKKSSALEQAGKAIEKIINSDQKKTAYLLNECVKLTKLLVKAGWFNRANDLFVQVEEESEVTFGSDHPQTISILESIGMLYQVIGRWGDAEERFEQALAARLSRYGETHESVKRLETALENQHYEPYLPSEKDLHACNEEHVIQRSAPSKVYLVGFPARRR